MGWNECLKNLVMMTAFMVALVVVQHAECEEGNYNIHDSARIFQHGGFVQRHGTNFVLNNKRFYFNGFNAYWLMYMASDPSTRPKVTTVLQQASNHGLTVARTWAFSDGGYRALQVSPGFYDEKVFTGLDFVISEAGKYGVRLILSLVNNWKDFGGKNQYVQWVKEHGQYVNSEDDFFSHPVVKQHYKNHIKAVLTRKNTISGVAYKDDPVIFAWELMNEPRSQQDNSGKVIQEWVIEMAAYVKSIDSNHLLEIGLEGFYGETTPEKKQFNPGYYLIGTGLHC
ncbi:Mannan endo-1,4-beta-mannosidase 5 [Spatholobus suberectus]|nr:Mannan endo-1,4-beta-mannosidase 5 [Spatholobus suberectus]